MNTTEQQILTGGASLTHEEDDNLIELLYKVRKDKYRWPTEASMRAAHGTVSHWATELVITRPPHPSMTGSHVLLARYEGGFEDWKQREVWHIPGGFNTPPDQSRASGLFWNFKSLQPVATKVARRELGVDVEVQALMDLFWWPSPTKEWREDIDVIMQELTQERTEKESVKENAFNKNNSK